MLATGQLELPHLSLSACVLRQGLSLCYIDWLGRPGDPPVSGSPASHTFTIAYLHTQMIPCFSMVLGIELRPFFLVSQILYIPSSQDQTHPLPARNFEGLLCLTSWIPEKRDTESNHMPRYVPDFPSKEMHSKASRISEHSICNTCHTNQI